MSGSETDSRNGIGDLDPTAALHWNQGVHNYMMYVMTGVPTGTYDVDRLANLGINHWAIDWGGGYTYCDAKTGHEASAALGVTYNFENPATDYRNGMSAHLDWGASQFFSERIHAGLVGYYYSQFTGDSGAGAKLGDFKSKVGGIGPQAGWFSKDGEYAWYVNLKGYYEFDAKNRPAGWNLWLTVAIPISHGQATAETREGG